MVAIKGRSIETFLSRLEPAASAVLFYGPDHGLIGERAKQVVKRALGEAAGDPFQAPVFPADAFTSDPGRLADELFSIPMFGGRKAVRVRGAVDALTPAVSAILSTPSEDALLVLEAGDLKPSSSLRKLMENTRVGAVSIGCYRDGNADVGRLIDQELAAVGTKPTSGARSLLVDLLGGDRAASRAELQKLALYAMGQETVSEADVQAILGDASGIETDDLLDAVFDGRAGEAAAAWRRLVSSGSDPSAIAGSALRRVDVLLRVSGKVEAGATIDAALGSLRPPPFFKRRDALARAARKWTRPALSDAAERLQEAVLATRQQPVLSAAIVERLLLALAMSARR